MNNLVKFKLPVIPTVSITPTNDPDFVLGKIRSGLNVLGESQRYIENPKEYLKLFGRPWSKQVEIIESVRDNLITLIRSANNIGKTWTAAAIILWFLDVYRPNATVISTAKTYDSVRYMLWAAIRKQYQMIRKERFNDAHMNLTDFSPDIWNHPKWQAMGYNPKIEGGLSNPESEAVAFQGHHNEHILFWIDEAITTHPAIFRAIEGSLTAKGARLGCTYNPTSTMGEIVRYERDERVNLIKISVFDFFDSPEYIAHPEDYRELANPEKVKIFINTYGKNSAIVLSRIFAKYPSQEINAAIDVNAFNMQIEMYDKYKDGADQFPFERLDTIIYSWDVAGEGTDTNVLGRLMVGNFKEEGDKESRRLLVYEQIEQWAKVDHEQSLLKVHSVMDDEYRFRAWLATESMKKDKDNIVKVPKFVFVVDTVGEGSHAPSLMRSMTRDINGKSWLNIIPFKAGHKAKKIPDRKDVDILNAISEAWYRSHLLIEHRVPHYPEIVINMPLAGQSEVINRIKHFAIRQREPQVWYIEPKEEYKARAGGSSPDCADALVQAIYAYFKGTGVRVMVI